MISGTGCNPFTDCVVSVGSVIVQNNVNVEILGTLRSSATTSSPGYQTDNNVYPVGRLVEAPVVATCPAAGGEKGKKVV